MPLSPARDSHELTRFLEATRDSVRDRCDPDTYGERPVADYRRGGGSVKIGLKI